MSSSAKVLVGQVLTAYRQYPDVRKALRGMPRGRHIFITGTPRSGTTWLAKMLAVPGVWYVHEPFNPNKQLWPEPFTYVRGDSDCSAADPLMKALLNGRHRRLVRSPARTTHWLMPLRFLPQTVNRTLIKDPIACLMSDYLTRRFDLETLVLFRHPAAFVSSMLRMQWSTAPLLRQFLLCEPLMRDWLSPFASRIERAAKNEGLESAAVFCGCLNTVLAGYVNQNRSMRHMLFERLCESPLDALRDLFTELELPYDDSTRQMHADHCVSEPESRATYSAHEVRRNSRAMADRWRTSFTQDDIAKIRDLWSGFELPMYQEAADW